MNEERLDKWIDSFAEFIKEDNDNIDGFDERAERKSYYQSFNYDKIINMNDEELVEYIKKLWSVMPISIYKIIDKNGRDNLKRNIAELLYGNGDMQDRFNNFCNNIVEFKIKAMSELLTLNYPNEYMLWDSKVESVFNLIGINNTNPYASNNYFDWYKEMISYGEVIRKKISDRIGKDVDLVDADYFYHYVATKEMNYKKLDRVLTSYYNNLEDYLPNEVYKWEAIQCFQDNWNLDSDDFLGMLERSFKQAGNLLTGFNYFPYGMIKGFAETEPLTVKEMFRNLFDESKELSERIENFVSVSDSLLGKYWDESKHHYQDLHSISTYLTFMYPEKYSIYKFSIAKKASNFLDYEISIKDKNISKTMKMYMTYKNYIKLCDRVMDHIKDKDDLLNKAERLFGITATNYNVFAQDVLYYIATKYMGTKYWILAPNPGNNNCWNEFLDRSIIRIGWEAVGDLTEFTDKQDFADELLKKVGGNTSKSNDAKALYDFTYEMNIGDYVLIKNGKFNMYGYGKVKSDYIYDGQNIRQVEWIKTGNFNMEGVAPEGGFATKTLTDITQYEDGEWAKRLIDRMEEKEIEKMEDNNIDENLISYYWMNANPKYWSFSNSSVGEIQEYTAYGENGNKRRVFANYESIKSGDIIVVYESSPKKEIVGLAEVISKDEDNNITFKKLEQFVNTIPYKTILEIEDLKNMEFIVNPQGSLFKLTKEEYNIIYELIRENNPKVNQTKKNEPYTRDQFDEKVFLPMDIYDDIVSILNRKRNVILQGPPGVGKTYMAKKIAFSMMGEIDETRIKVVQFHQSYSYEDFVEGYRPAEEGDGFERKKGIFYEFCIKAENDQEKRPYFFIIDEINRGNLSKIFGELLVLLEKDKRANTKVNLAYSDTPFTIPDNVYIIGMMNTADRSLAIMDYALRRRFSFVEIKPAFKYPKWIKYQEDINNELFDRIISAINEINDEIARDPNLTTDCMIGHSYFSDLKTIVPEELHSIVKYEVLPLLKEYYIDNPGTYERFYNKLEGVFKQ